MNRKERITHHVTLYDPQSKKSALILILPERRVDDSRPKGRYSVFNFVRHTFGIQWTEAHRHLLGFSKVTNQD